MQLVPGALDFLVHPLHCDEWVEADSLRSEHIYLVPPNPDVY